MSTVKLLTLLICVPLCTASIFADTLLEQNSFRACESLRSSSAKVRIIGVNELFKPENRSLTNLTLLKYLWVSEPDASVRNKILNGFIQIGDHRFISDPEFPQYWIDSLAYMHTSERALRETELQQLTNAE